MIELNTIHAIGNNAERRAVERRDQRQLRRHAVHEQRDDQRRRPARSSAAIQAGFRLTPSMKNSTRIGIGGDERPTGPDSRLRAHSCAAT